MSEYQLTIVGVLGLAVAVVGIFFIDLDKAREHAIGDRAVVSESDS